MCNLKASKVCCICLKFLGELLSPEQSLNLGYKTLVLRLM